MKERKKERERKINPLTSDLSNDCASAQCKIAVIYTDGRLHFITGIFLTLFIFCPPLLCAPVITV